jgi:alpha/beta superfamily hydrolase
MIKILKPSAILLAAALLAACGGSASSTTATVSASTTPGTLSVNPPFRIASLDAAALQAALGATAAGAQLLQLTGNPVCGVDFYYLKFMTAGGAGEMTQSSGALMVPTGAAPTCSGPLPMIEYAHGTWTDQAMNIANITDPANTEGALIAAMFAAQGYIVVAPNYAGYDISTLGYHPYLNAEQQSGEMMDILAAARSALPNLFTHTTVGNGKLFLTGYSQGGHVAMATLRALKAAGDPVTAAAPMSGPYALEAFGDVVFFGKVNLGSTVFSPLLANSYEHAYSNINNDPAGPIFSSTYPNAETQLPSTTPIDTIFAESLLPELALFDSTTPVVNIPTEPGLSALLTAALAVPPIDPANPATAIWHAGFGNPYLINNNYRVSYAVDAATYPDGAVPAPQPGVPLAKSKPTQGLRQDFYINDLRNGPWAPTVPTLMCGGSLDPTVYFSVNTGTMAAFWKADPYVLPALDVDPQPPSAPGGPFVLIQEAFQTSQAQLFAFYQTPAGGGLSAAAAQQKIVQGYHVAVSPFCTLAARSFFSQF